MQSNQYTSITTASLVLVLLILIGCQPKEGDRASAAVDQVETALSQLNDAIAEQPRAAEGYLQRASYYMEKEFYSEAVADYILCVEYDSSVVDCWHGLSDAYLADNRSRLAIETLEDYLRLHPKDIPSLLKIARLQTIIERYAAAHMNLNTVLKMDPTHANALLYKGMVFRYEDRPLEAVEHLQRAIQSNPDLEDGHIMLGQLFEAAENPAARKYFENAVRVAPENPETSLGLANYLWRTDQVDQALAIYRKLNEDHPAFTRAFFNKGLLLLEIDSVIAARNAFEQILALEPENVPAHYYLGESMGLQGDWLGAKQQFEKALNFEPSNEKIKLKITEADYNLKK